MATKILVFIEQRKGQLRNPLLKLRKQQPGFLPKLSGVVEAVTIGNEI